MKKLCVFLATFFVFYCSVGLCFGEEKKKEIPDKLDCNVMLSIEGQENLKSQLTSYLRREFRSFNDVQIVYEKDEADFIISVTIAEIDLIDRTKSGITIYSLAVLSPYADSLLLNLFGDGSKEKEKQLKNLTQNLYNFELNTVGYSSDGIEAIAKDIVVYVDNKFLEDRRKLNKSILESIKKFKQKEEK